MRRIKKAEIRSYLWQGDCPFLTFIYPGFDCGSVGLTKSGKEETNVGLDIFRIWSKIHN